jgi:hypothetical protein
MRGKTAMSLLYGLDIIWTKVLVYNLVYNGYGWNAT